MSLRNYAAAVLMLLLAATALSQSAYERKTFTKVEPDKHSSTSLQNAEKQSVIMQLDTAVALDSGETWTNASSPIKLQNLLYGYPTGANLIVDMTAGSISAVWRENYGTAPEDTVHLQDAQDPDSGQVIVAVATPWSTAGCWRWYTDFGGGSSYYYTIKAHADGTVLRGVGVQLLP